jgi:HD-GYP domain-containing protein (c-di-GMP phosphodiesterase class II)
MLQGRREVGRFALQPVSRPVLFPPQTAGAVTGLETKLADPDLEPAGAIEIIRGALAHLDGYTAAHCERVGALCITLCDEFGLGGGEREEILTTARLHDVGMLGVPVEILEKPETLGRHERDLAREHVLIGEQVLGSIAGLGGPARLVRHSHERWDGQGYPDGLADEEIPLGSRIIFCADAFDAIRSDRPYRRGRPTAEAIDELRGCAGSQFDPDVVDAIG